MRNFRFALLVCLVAVLTLPASSGLSAQQAVKWDINAPVGPTSPIEFDTNEGTWMNVDVSPDGRQVIASIVPTFCRPAIWGS